MRTVRFLEERTEKRAGGQTFEKGSVHLLDDGSALHWVKRGVAIEVKNITQEFTNDHVESDSIIASEIETLSSDFGSETNENGDSMGSSKIVVESDSSDNGERPVNEPTRRRGRPASRNSGNSGQ